MVATRSNMQLAELKPKPHGGLSIRYLIDHKKGACLYPPPVSSHQPLLCLEKFHGTTHQQTNSKDDSNKN